jgi:preprotein translocase subunit SecA
VKLTIREILLSTFDNHWKDHLLNMDHLKEGIGLRSYGQKDPLVEYKREAFDIYEDMKVQIKHSVVGTLFEVRLYTPEEVEEIKRQQKAQLEAQLAAAKQAQIANQGNANASTVKRETPKVGRNDPCPCGSGKKYKHCHGA